MIVRLACREERPGQLAEIIPSSFAREGAAAQGDRGQQTAGSTLDMQRLSGSTCAVMIMILKIV
jgi:hypothetical protein